MKRFPWAFMLFLNYVAVSAQQDSIFISAKFNEGQRDVLVKQEITYTNKTAVPLAKIKLLNWTAAYRNNTTPLASRKLEDRKTAMYFAKPNELGRTQNLEIKIGENSLTNLKSSEENIYIPLTKSLQPGEKVKISLNYKLELPLQKFTSYGSDGSRWMMKYFFIVPDTFEDEAQTQKHFIDIEENQSPGNYWKMNLDVPANYFSQSNLNEIQPNSFEGTLKKDPEFLISKNNFPTLLADVDGQKISVQLGYDVTEAEKANMEVYLPKHLQFIKEKTGLLPEKIFISEKFRKQESFMGIDDIKFWKFHYKLFSDAEQADLNYFSILSKNVVERAATFEKSTDHWLVNGLKTYLEIQYIKKNYPDRKLLGDLPETAQIFGLKPLKIFHASKLELASRYGLGYQYMMTQNLDQPIAIPFEKLSNFNALAISHFETGSLLDFVAEKMGHEKFAETVLDYFAQNGGKKPDLKEFLDRLALASNYSADFLEPFVEHKNRVNFRLKRFKKSEDNFHIKVSKNTKQQIPFKLETAYDNGLSETYWFDTDQSKKTVTYTVPQLEASKIVINNDYIFPETNFRDNYLYTQGFFSNTKKVRLKLFKDIPNPEYNEIYISPRLSFNAYDKVLLGINFKNESLFPQKFNYTITPYFSTGTGSLAGSAAVGYSFQPAESFFRSLNFAVSASHFHYDYDLTYRKISAGASMNFSKEPRSAINRNLAFSYNYFEKDLNPAADRAIEYGKYNLWNLGYGYSDRRAIHEKYVGANVQWMEDFQKISAEASYRYEFAENKKINLRFFGGYFLSNSTKNNLFDYGISRVSNYAFSYGLLGQSASSGVLSQQFILAEGGFKSYVGGSANQWIGAFNVDSHVWKWFNVYADAGVYKNKYENPQFIWDSGVKLKVIPDFLEVYFPIQSSLGFEPKFKDYAQRIRFTLMLNFGAMTDYFRRGWF